MKGKGDEGEASPEPAVGHPPPQELKQRSRPQSCWFAGGLHAMSDGDLAASAAENQNRKRKNDARHATASLATAVVRGFVCPTSSTPVQIKTTPIQRRGDTDSCKKTTASKVSSA